MTEKIDTLIRNVGIVSMDPSRRVIRNGGIAIAGDRITHVGPMRELPDDLEPAATIDGSRLLATPGFVNSHIHFYHQMHRGLAPDTFDGHEWSNFVHDHFAPHMTAEVERWAAAQVAMEIGRSGTTTYLAAGSYNPHDVLPVLPGLGLRGFESRRTFDLTQLDHASLVDDTATCIRENRRVMEAFGDWLGDSLVQPCVNIVGLGRCSDELLVASKELADEYGAILNFHQCAFVQEVAAVQERTGRTPIQHLYDLGVLGSNVVLAHMLHVTDEEIDLLAETGTHVVHNPGTALKLVYGLSAGGRFPEMLDRGVNVALGTDAGDCANFMDITRAIYLAALLFKDIRNDPGVMGAEAALEMATLNGARALGLEADIGSIEVGKKADLVLFDTDVPEWQPLYCEPYNLVYSASGASVDTVIVDGDLVVKDGHMVTVDEEEVTRNIRRLAPELLAASGVGLPTSWPVVE